MPQVRSGGALGALALRVVLGPVIAYHGYLKVRGGIPNFAGFVEALGIPLPTPTAFAVTFLELVGGILILVGLLTRIWSLLLAVEMVLTTLLVKVDVGLIAPQGQGSGAELDLLIFAGALALALMGPGAISLDHLFGIERPHQQAGA